MSEDLAMQKLQGSLAIPPRDRRNVLGNGRDLGLLNIVIDACYALLDARVREPMMMFLSP